ncbi:DTW domain-containing protein [Vibrio lentus]|nr:DTW domain-containing protein [Vibrio lentus]
MSLSFFSIHQKSIAHWNRVYSLVVSKNSVTLVGEDFSENTHPNELLADEQYQHVILYPSEHSVSVESAICPRKNWCVILLDGHGKKAFKMWQVSSNLHALQTVLIYPKTLKVITGSAKHPVKNSLSTVEKGWLLFA